MDAVNAFFAMGGYAAFIWPAFALTAVIMLGLLLQSRRQWRAQEAALEALQTAGGGRRRRPVSGATAAAGPS
jgi:heme exporter protein D